MEMFRKIEGLKGKKKFILKEMNYKSINEAKKYFDNINGKNNSEKVVYNYLKFIILSL